MYNVLFVCSGNTCRSPIAQGMLKKRIEEDPQLKDKVFVGSCGLGAFFGDPANDMAIKAAEKYGVDITDHKSTCFDPLMFEKYDLILTMAKSHKDAMVLHAPEYKDKIFCITEYCNDTENYENVKDPYGGTQESYDRCASQLNSEIEKLFSKIKGLISE